MKINNLLIGLGITLTFAGCSKDLKNNPTPPKSGDTTVTTPPAPVPYSITEDFENGTKTSYAAADITLNTGSWNFNDALIGNLAADLKDGNKSVRLRTGSIAMNFDINGLTTLYIKHGKYGTDATSTWQLLMSTDQGATYTQVGSDISETNTTLVTDSFKVSVTGKVRFQIKKAGTTRINIDDITFKGTGDPGITVGTPDTGSGDGDTGGGTGSVTTPRDVTAGVDAPPSTGDNSNLLFGNPSNATATLATMDNYLIDQKYYVESYNATKGEPNWVSWHLDNTNTTGTTDRLNNFAGWSGLPTAWYQVESNSYVGSGFDRGHNCPSADRTSSADANSATFLMTNMIPQAPQNNRVIWADLENYLREQVVEGNEVYIIMGVYGTGGIGSNGAASTINNGHVNVPSNVWKIALIIPKGDGDVARVTASTRVIAVNTPNINTIDTDWTKYITTIKSIETATGYTLLSSLPTAVRTALEVKVDNGAGA